MNENYFEQIDTEAKAYFLGFLLADGCISQTNTRKNAFCFNVVGTLDICKNLEKIFSQFLIEENKSKNIICANNVYKIYYNKLISLKRIYNYLYKDATIFLIRKEEKFYTIFKKDLKVIRIMLIIYFLFFAPFIYINFFIRHKNPS